MRLSDIFDLAINMGKEVDIRGKNLNIDYFPDSRIINYKDTNVKSIFVGIDIGVPEIILVEILKSQGVEIDAIISHHPIAKASYALAKVADIQKYNWIQCGINKKIAEKLINKLIWESSIGIKAKNNLRAENASKFLNIPLICLHTAIDNLTQKFFEDITEGNKPLRLVDLFEIISSIKEYEMAKENDDGPYISDLNLKNNIIKKVMVDMTGGLDPPSEIFAYLKKSNVNTIIGMHYSLDNMKAIIKHKIGTIICGHMASDSIGLNIYCDILEKEKIKILAGPGFYRISKN